MIKEAIQTILALKKPEQITVNGSPYYDKTYAPAQDIFPEFLSINNLTGIVDFIQHKPEKWGSDLFIHVRDFNSVVLYQSMSGNFNQRTAIICAFSRPCRFPFSRGLSVEDFIISVNGMFIRSDDRDYVLQFISGVRVDANSKIEDNGISQKVTARMGASSLVSDIEIKPVVVLQPFRTFTEVEQPESKFVFRLKLEGNTPMCSLHECDGEAWKQDAIIRIKDYFEQNGVNIPIIA